MGLIHFHQMMIEDMKVKNSELALKLNYKLQRNHIKGGIDVFDEKGEIVNHFYGTLELHRFLKTITVT